MKNSTPNLIAAMAWTIATFSWVLTRADGTGITLAVLVTLVFYASWIVERRKKDQFIR